MFKRKRKNETRDIDVASLLCGNVSGSQISFDDALQIPAVAASIDFITGICARAPVKLYQEDANGTVEIKDDSRVELLNNDTGDLLNAYQMKKAWVTDYYNGRGYIFVNWQYNKVKSLHYVERSKISVIKNTDPIFKDADIYVAEHKYYPFQFLRLCRDSTDGVTGKSIVETNGILLELYYKTLKFERELMTSGGNKKGFLKSEKRLDNDAITKIRESWRNLFNKSGNNMMILNSGMDFKETSATSAELQLNENKITNANDLTMLFLLSAKALQGASDDEVVAAVKTAVMPILEQMEMTYNQAMLLEAEKKTKYFVCDTSRLERGDILKRYQAYQIALNSNFMQPDEIRYKEDMSPLGLNWIKLGLDSVLYNPATGEIYTPNTNQTTNIKKVDE